MSTNSETGRFDNDPYQRRSCSCPSCCPVKYQIATLPPIPHMQQGCICPPTSEQTCMNPACPRKPIISAGGGNQGQ